jgi:hypothetical protein
MNIRELVRDIIKTEMNLTDAQITQENQEYKLPVDTEIHLVIGILAEKVFANNKYYENRAHVGYYEIQSLQKMTTFSIDIFSKGMGAVDRKEEIIFALNSYYSENQQTTFAFKIMRLPTGFTNISEIEGSARINRFNITFNVLNFVIKETKIDDYNTFSYTVITNQ